MHCPSIFCIGPQPSHPCEWNTQQLTWSPLTVFTYSLCVFVPFVNEMFCRPVDDTRPVWESSLPLFFSSPSSSLAYISSINPVLGGLLWSLCVLWAMVIISLLRSHCFMCLVCSLPLVPRSLSPVHTISLSLSPTLSPHLCYAASTSTLSPSLPLITRQYLFFHFACLSSYHSHIQSFASCYLSIALTAAQMQVQQFNLWSCTRQVDHGEIYPSISLFYKLRPQQIAHPLNLQHCWFVLLCLTPWCQLSLFSLHGEGMRSKLEYMLSPKHLSVRDALRKPDSVMTKRHVFSLYTHQSWRSQSFQKSLSHVEWHLLPTAK